VKATLFQYRKDMVPGANMLCTACPPHPSVAAKFCIDVIFVAKGLNTIDGRSESLSEHYSIGLPTKRLQRFEFGPLRKDHATVPSRRAASADVGFNDRHVAGRIVLLYLN
jgi:hypothetical protein